MATYTSRMGLIKPAGSEPRSITPIASDMDLLDKFMPCILVNDGVTPPTVDLYDGALVKERTSGIIWEARKNGGGTYDKVYVRYPYAFSAYYTGVPLARGSGVWPNFTDSGFDAVNAALCKNSSIAHLTGSPGGWRVPIKGIYQIHLRTAWATSGAGGRGGCMRLNAVNMITAPSNNTTKEVGPTPGTSDTVVDLNFPWLLNANDVVTNGVYQSSGGSLQQNQSFIQVSMIEPVQ